MNNSDERDYAEEAANRALLHEDDEPETRVVESDWAIFPTDILIATYGEDAPQGGESMHWRDLLTHDQYPYDGERVEYLLIKDTSWGDYNGSAWTRSNYRVFERDYRDHLVEVYCSAGSKQWALRIGAEVPVELFNSIVFLSDYPILDDEDHWQLEEEIQAECWESFGRQDFYSEITTHAYSECPDDELPELDDPDALLTLFHEARERCDYLYGDFETEGATSGYWREMGRLARSAWRQIKDRRDGLLPIPGQLTLI